MYEIGLLLSLVLMILWTIGPLVVLIIYQVPPLRRCLGLDDSAN